MAIKLSDIKEIEGVKYARLGDDGHPVYVNGDGKPVDQNVPHLMQTKYQAEEESKKRKLKIAEMKERFESLEGIDPVKAREALELAAQMESKKLVDAGKIDDAVVAQVAPLKEQLEREQAAARANMEKLSAERDQYKGKLERLTFDSIFDKSEFAKSPQFTTNHALREHAKNQVWQNIKYEDGELVGYENGQKMLSEKFDGSYAGPDEIIARSIKNSPYHKDYLVNDNLGGGAKQGGPAINSGRIEQFANATPEQKMAMAKNGFQVVG